MKTITYVKSFAKRVILSLFGEYYRAKIINYFLARPINEFYGRLNDSIAYDRKLIIYKSDEKGSYWGLCDRLRGIVSTYKYCRENNCEFKIYFVHPFELEMFLEPNVHNWKIDTSEISYDSKKAKAICVAYLSDKKEVEETVFIEALSINLKQIHVYTNTWTGDDCFSEYFNYLFKPSKVLESKIEWNLEQIGEKYIALQFRFLELLGDLKECMDVPHLKDEEEKEKLINNGIEAILRIKKENSQYRKFLLASDSVTFVNRAKSIEGIYVVPGDIGHSGVVSSHDANLKTFLDLFMLAKAEKIYSVVIPPMRNSKFGFAERASKINNVPFKQFLFTS